MQSMPITTNVVSSNPTQASLLDATLCDTVCYVVTCGRSGFFPDTLVSSTNKIDSHDITEILLKVALNTIPSPPHSFHFPSLTEITGTVVCDIHRVLSGSFFVQSLIESINNSIVSI
jgi:hypothetical protein